MSRKTYVGAVGEVVESMGFVRQTEKVRGWGPYWSRTVGNMEETVELARSIDLGTSVSLYMTDTALDALLREALPDEPGASSGSGAFSIGNLNYGVHLKNWWKNDPDGPTELAAAVKERVEPFFARYRDPRDQAEWLYDRYGRGRRSEGGTIPLALTLYRLGEYDEALSVFQPHRKLTPPQLVRRIDTVQAWLQKRIDEIRNGS